MTDHSHSTGEANLVAIDIAKEWNVVLVQEINGAKQSFKVATMPQTIISCLLHLSSLSGRTRVALEPTGDFHRPLAFRLLQAGFEVVSISSVAEARFREARYGTWDKNDPENARVILAMLAQRLVQTYYDPLFKGTHDWQELSNTYYQVTLARTRLQHSLLLHYLPLYFRSSAVIGIPHGRSGSSVFLIAFRFLVPVRALTRDDFVKEAWDIVGQKWDKRAKLPEIYELAASSIGLPVDVNSPAVETLRLQLERYAEINDRRSWLDQRAQEFASREPGSPSASALLPSPQLPGKMFNVSSVRHPPTRDSTCDAS